jgi:hypothetical protein
MLAHFRHGAMSDLSPECAFKPNVTASLWGCLLGEQLGAGRGELHVGPGCVAYHPPFVDRHLDTGAELLCRAAGLVWFQKTHSMGFFYK